MKCSYCGTQWPAELADVLKFCGACGKPLQSAAPQQEISAASVVSAPGGELRFMTVLFADLAGFTTFAEDRSPDDVAGIVGDLLQRLGTIVKQYNGAVDKFLGDAVVVTFGLLHPDVNAARNAVRAGLAMQQQTARFNGKHGFNFGLRIGIHAGEAMFRAIGGSWTVMGDTVNTASRIQSSAAPGKVWISHPVYNEVRRYFDLSLKPAVELKGKRHTIQPFEVIAERLVPLIDLAPFVGREAEWELIQSTLRGAVQKQTLKVLFARGAAGVGKSRLVWELGEWAQRAEELYRLDIVQYDHSERLPSHGLNAIIRSRFNLPLELDENALLTNLQNNIPVEYPAALDGRETLATEFFAFVLGVLRADFQIHSMDGLAKWQNAFLEIKAWIESQARQEQPWIIVLEDAHKGDADTAAFLDWALKMEWHAPVLIFITVREEDFTPECFWYEPLTRWVKGGMVGEMNVHEIEPATLARALKTLGGGSFDDNLCLRVAEHTEGNPLFAIEIALLLKEQGVTSTENLPLPNSIREVMEARLERLGLAGKEVAKRGALMGRRFTLEAVGRIWDRPPVEMTTGLEVLRETETIYQEASRLFVGEMEQVFRHGRLQEAALARIPREERQRWLAELEQWAKIKLETFGSYWEGVGLLLVPLIVRSRLEHGDFTQAGLWNESLGWLHRKHHRNQEATNSFLEAIRHASGIRRLILQRMVAELDLASGALERAHEILHTALQKAETIVPPPEMPKRIRTLIDDPLAHWDRMLFHETMLYIKLTYGEALVRLGQSQKAEEVYKEIERTLRGMSGPKADLLRLRWGNQWGYLLSEVMANPKTAEQVYAQIRNSIDMTSPELQAERFAFISTEFNAEMRLGRFDRASILVREMLQVAQQAGNLRQEARAWNSLGITANSLGNWEEAADSYERALALARSIGERRLEAISQHNLGIIRMDQARYEEARACQENYLAVSLATGNRMAESYAPAYLGLIAYSEGSFEDSQILIHRSMHIAQDNNWTRLIGLNQGLLAMLGLHRILAFRVTSDLPRVTEAFSSSEEHWCNIDEAGEFYAALVISQFLAGDEASARTTLARAHANVDASWTAARIFLELAETILKRKPLEPLMGWFREHHFIRAMQFTEKVAAM
jgi:class 3 adenylate cyclase/predicted ATPase